MGKEGIKMYPLNRYVVERDGNGNVIEIVTKEKVNKDLILNLPTPDPTSSVDNSGSAGDSKDCEVYTCVKLTKKGWAWHQEVDDQILPDSFGKAPKDKSPFYLYGL